MFLTIHFVVVDVFFYVKKSKQGEKWTKAAATLTHVTVREKGVRGKQWERVEKSLSVCVCV